MRIGIRRVYVLQALLVAGMIGIVTPASGGDGSLANGRDAIAYLVRHAEKATDAGNDPSLSPAGRERAVALARRLDGVGLERILSTDTRRATQTAEPLASKLEIEIETYDPRELAELARGLRAAAQTVLVVGHSNTTPELVRLLGGAPGPPIADDEYDRLYLLRLATAETVVEPLAPRVAGDPD